MSTITKERAELKSFITGFLSDPMHDDQSAKSMTAEVFRIALASLEAEPVAYMWDSDRKDVDAPGYYRPEHKIFAETSVKRYGGKVVALYAAPPAPVSVPDEIESTSGSDFDDYYCDGWNACRAAMLQGADGNSPVIADCWVLVPVEPTYQMCEAMGLSWESPRFPDRYKAMISAVKQ